MVNDKYIKDKPNKNKQTKLSLKGMSIREKIQVDMKEYTLLKINKE